MAEWLNTVFGGMDASMFEMMHGLAESGLGGLFTFLFKVFSLLLEKGALAWLTGLVLLLFKKTRKIGICMIGAIGLGAIVTNLTLKDLVARPRPYLANETFRSFWEYVGSKLDEEFSFPSGHTTAAFSGAMGLFLTGHKKWSWVGLPIAVCVALSRVYLVMHYTSDVLAGMLIGLCAGGIAFGITVLIYKLLDRHQDVKFFRFVLNFDLIEAIRRKPAPAQAAEPAAAEAPKDEAEPSEEERKEP